MGEPAPLPRTTTVSTTVVGCIGALVAGFLGYHLLQFSLIIDLLAAAGDFQTLFVGPEFRPWTLAVLLTLAGLAVGYLASGRFGGWPVAAGGAALAAIALSEFTGRLGWRWSVLMLAAGLVLAGTATAISHPQLPGVARRWAAGAFAAGFFAAYGDAHRVDAFVHDFDDPDGRIITAPLAFVLAGLLTAVAVVAARLSWPGRARMRPVALLALAGTAGLFWCARIAVQALADADRLRTEQAVHRMLHPIYMGALAVIAIGLIAAAARLNGPSGARWVSAGVAIGVLLAFYYLERPTLGGPPAALLIFAAVTGAALAHTLGDVPVDALALLAGGVVMAVSPPDNRGPTVSTWHIMAILVAVAVALGAALVPIAADTTNGDGAAVMLGLAGLVIAAALVIADIELWNDIPRAGHVWAASIVLVLGGASAVFAVLARRGRGGLAEQSIGDRVQQRLP